MGKIPSAGMDGIRPLYNGGKMRMFSHQHDPPAMTPGWGWRPASA
jgi:hypothetical protein